MARGLMATIPRLRRTIRCKIDRDHQRYAGATL